MKVEIYRSKGFIVRVFLSENDTFHPDLVAIIVNWHILICTPTWIASYPCPDTNLLRFATFFGKSFSEAYHKECFDLNSGLLLFNYSKTKMARKSGKKLKENLVGCTGEGKIWKGNIRERSREGKTGTVSELR